MNFLVLIKAVNKTKNMHILIIPSWYPSHENPIRGSFFREQTLALSESGKQVGVIYPDLHSLKNFIKGNKNWNQGLEIENDCGVITYRWHEWGWSSRIPYLYEINFLKIGMKLFQVYVEQHGLPDIIHAHSVFMGGCLANKIKSIYQIPYVLTEHSSSIARGIIRSWQKSAIEKSFRESELLVVVSPNLGRDLKINYPNSISDYLYIPNIVNVKFFGNLRERKNTDFFTFLNISAMIPLKRQKDILIAFASRFSGNKNVKLQIVGSGPLRKKIEAITIELDINSQVDFLGQVDRNKIYSVIKSCDVLVHASEYETFGVVLVEALACGLPVISTKCGGAECIVNHKNGLLVPIADIQSLALAMQDMYQNYSFYDSVAISQDCHSNFSPNVVISRISKVYEQILNNHTN